MTPWDRVCAAAAGLVIAAAIVGVPQGAHAAPKLNVPPSLVISSPRFSTSYDHEHRRSLLVISTDEHTNITPYNFSMFITLYRWGAFHVGKPYKHGKLYFGCGAAWDLPCVWHFTLADLASQQDTVHWIRRAICNTEAHQGGGGGRFYVELKMYHPATVVEYFPSKAPHKKQPDRKESYQAKCPRS